MNDFEIIRLSRDERRIILPTPPTGGTPVQLMTRLGPSTAGAFFRARPTVVGGDEVEGGEATTDDDLNTTELVYPLGAALSAGGQILAWRVPNRWVTASGKGKKPPGTCPYTIYVAACCSWDGFFGGTGGDGYTITATKGAFTATATTVGGGAYLDLSGAGGGAGTYHIVVTGGPYPASADVVVTCSPYDYHAFLPVDPGATLYWSDGAGTMTMTRAGFNPHFWLGQRNMPATVVDNCSPYFNDCDPTWFSGSACVNYTFGCSGNTPGASAGWLRYAGRRRGGFGGLPECPSGSPAPPAGAVPACCWGGGYGGFGLPAPAGCGDAGPDPSGFGMCLNTSSNFTVTSFSCSPFIVTLEPAPFVFGGPNIAGNGTVTITN